MVARCKPPQAALTVSFNRDGELSILITAANGEQALMRTIRMLMAHKRLEPGDKITVEVAD